MRRTLRAVSLFSGCGGLDIGVRNVGFEIESCIEIDHNCCDTLRANCEKQGVDTEIIESDIRQVDPITAAHGKEIDLLFGGSPCQAFSQIGKQGSIADERGMLLFEVPRFAKALDPDIVLMEQVKGVLNAKDHDGVSGGVFRMLCEEFEELGYQVQWKVLLASDYGVPQKRQRVFIVATKPGFSFAFPEPTHGDVKQGDVSGLRPYVTVGEAIDDLPAPLPKTADSEQPEDSHYDVTPPRDRERIHGVPEGECLARQLYLPESQRGRLTKKDTTKFLRLGRGKVSNTLRGGEIFYHPTEDRYLTPREYMRIHSYPDSYVLKGPIKGRSGTYRQLDQHRQIGNSVPPLLGQCVALKIKEAIDAHGLGNANPAPQKKE